MSEHVPRPVRPRVTARTSYRIAPLVRPNRLYRAIAARLERMPRALRLFTGLERRSKEALYGCRMCGQCALPATAYACPMTCPKQLRNGPCGGVAPNGDCEVHPGERCVWLIAYERAAATGHESDLALLQRPIDQRLRGTSSWVHYWLGRDEGLWTDAAPRESVRRAPVELGMPQVPR
ncbi:methylenetetrahydrofolate reductase C-terminal domain-containing protein [Pseudonocardia sp. MH-G8]|uniref:methylenetetrahydrofolate reductase C-terminal domain-containing protein n=1 Tax=Pseudonocardia sp. MH-G8 TaxID=1854588 RepID=UPI000BA0B082|nr:methylenetetrahydrofolate reductase C-terminal domain-containing protein [Pseudonocardia sp. MH-G8]OZM75948.1 hypothetical protein CFP66_43550 [Pseudonocardia sp. MH-G8]